jgi:hypothetical protein
MEGTDTLEVWKEKDLKKGELVKIDGERGIFVFQSVRMDVITPVYVTVTHLVTGGKSKRGTRMILPGRITKMKDQKQIDDVPTKRKYTKRS